LQAVAAAFGNDVLNDDGSLDRKALAGIIFGDDDKRRRLNAIVHPVISQLTLDRTAALNRAGHVLACYEAALLVENGIADGFRPLVLVAASESTQCQRATVQDHATNAEIQARIRAQLPLSEKIKFADFVIENDGSLDDLRRRSDDVLNAIRTRFGISTDEHR
jgi:dephospho-CoA kinase